MDFVAIDFETANETPASACSIGLVKVRAAVIEDTMYCLIKPPDMRFSSYNVAVHGIRPADVADQPSFAENWPQIVAFIGTLPLVAHFAQFDMRVLRSVLEYYDINDYPRMLYYCSWVVAKKAWPGQDSYKLNKVANLLGIEFNHHHALDDARASAEIIIRASRELGAGSVHDLCTFLKFKPGVLSPGHCVPLKQSTESSKRQGFQASDIIPSATDFDPRHPLYRKSVMFTGTLQSMKRREAAQKVADAGGFYCSTFTDAVDYLVCGDKDLTKPGSGTSRKLRQVEEAVSSGQSIEIISESDFIKLIQ